MLQNFTFPHSHSGNWARMDAVTQEECGHLTDVIAKAIEAGQVVDIKDLIMKVRGKMADICTLFSFWCFKIRDPSPDSNSTVLRFSLSKKVQFSSASDDLPLA